MKTLQEVERLRSFLSEFRHEGVFEVFRFFGVLALGCRKVLSYKAQAQTDIALQAPHAQTAPACFTRTLNPEP